MVQRQQSILSNSYNLPAPDRAERFQAEREKFFDILEMKR
jgi:hypothetical protein